MTPRREPCGRRSGSRVRCDPAACGGGLALVIALMALLAVPVAAQQTHIVVITGLSGDSEYADQFHEWATTLIDVAIDRYELPEDADKRICRLEHQNRVILSLEVDRVHFGRSDGRRGIRVSV